MYIIPVHMSIRIIRRLVADGGCQSSCTCLILSLSVITCHSRLESTISCGKFQLLRFKTEQPPNPFHPSIGNLEKHPFQSCSWFVLANPPHPIIAKHGQHKPSHPTIPTFIAIQCALFDVGEKRVWKPQVSS